MARNMPKRHNWPIVILSLFLVPLFVLFFYKSAQHGNASYKTYIKMPFAGKIDTIYRYDKNRPVVSLSGRRMTIQEGSHGFSTYLSVGDSVNKAANTDVLITYRVVPGISGHRIQVSVWGDDPDNKLGYWGLVDRYYIQDKLIKY